MSFDDAASQWDQRYRTADGLLFGAAPNAWLAASVDLLPDGSRVLCIADGEGRNSTWLAGRGHAVQAFDISPVAVQKLGALAAERAVTVDARVASVDDWHWPVATLDVVVAVFIQFADPTTRRRVFERIQRALKPGGVLVIEGYGPRQMQYRTGGPGIAEHLYRLPQLLQAFDGWHVLRARNLDADITEGSGHVGRSHLVSAVLQKPTVA